jgi:hypothetical protein
MLRSGWIGDTIAWRVHPPGTTTPCSGSRSAGSSIIIAYSQLVAVLDVVRSVEIDADAAMVRRQFGDVAHHASALVHRGVSFEVLADDATRCRYRQVSRVGPLRLRQEFELQRTEDGPMVNRIVSGQFTGGAITFDVARVDDRRASVTARLTASLSGPMAVLAPVLRRQVGKQLAAALDEDKHDLESGRYADATGAA